jgi:ParB family chromosome partitioning protein
MVLHLAPAMIEPDPNQPRQEFDEDSLNRLAGSLRDHGQLQPVLVRKDRGRYVLVAGERRWRAAKRAGLSTVQALLCTGGDVLTLQLIENLLREDLKPVEQARSFAAIMKKEGWSARELGRQLSLDHTGITRALKLIDLPKEVQEAVDEGEIPPTTAYEISKRPR